MTSPSNTEDVGTLIARLREATESSVELDCAAYAAAGDVYLDHGAQYWRWLKPGGARHSDYSVPPFTSSIDAALTLVPSGMEWSISTLYGPVEVQVGLNAVDGPWMDVRADGNIPLAICATALEARRQSP